MHSALEELAASPGVLKSRIAVISVHGSPISLTGGKDSGGMNVYVRELARELGHLGLEIDVFTRWNDSSLPQIVKLGENARLVHIKAGPLDRLSKQQIYQYLPEFFCNLVKFKEENGLSYSLVHSHYWLSGWVGSLLQNLWRIPHIVMFHTLGETKRRARLGENEPGRRIETEREIVAVADLIIAGGSDEKTHLIRYYNAEPTKIAVIPCGVDLRLFRPMNQVKARQQLGIAEDKVVLFVGRIEPLKGIDILLDAVARLEDMRNLRLIIVGGDSQSDDEVERLRQHAVEVGIGARVSFIGAVEQQHLPFYYNAADVCVVPSFYESFGMVAVEALACGVPVVAARVGGLMTTVRDGETGFLIPWHCPEPFAERLELLLSNGSLRRDFGRAARSSVERFGWSLIGEQVIKVYESLLSDTNMKVCCVR